MSNKTRAIVDLPAVMTQTSMEKHQYPGVAGHFDTRHLLSHQSDAKCCSREYRTKRARNDVVACDSRLICCKGLPQTSKLTESKDAKKKKIARLAGDKLAPSGPPANAPLVQKPPSLTSSFLLASLFIPYRP
jgi:hypothetical protein